MNTNTLPYHVIDLTPGRRAWVNALDLSGPTHWMYGLVEVDVTVAQQLNAEHKRRTGEQLSFTGFLVYCLARAVDENKEVQAYLKGHKQIIMFDDVNVGLMVAPGLWMMRQAGWSPRSGSVAGRLELSLNTLAC